MSELVYRLADKSDLQAVYTLYMEPGSNFYLTYDPMDLPAFEKIYDELLQTQTLYVAETNRTIIGSYRLIRKTHRQQHAAYLGGFVVSSANKGHGFGSRMLQHIKEDALNQGITRIELTVDINNSAAIALYKKLGFEIEGTVRESYTVAGTGKLYDEYLMSVIMK